MSLRVTLIQGGGAGSIRCRRSGASSKRRAWPSTGTSISPAGRDGARGRRPAGRDAPLRARTGLALKTKLLPPPGRQPAGRPAGEVATSTFSFRRELGLFASVRPLKNLPGLPARFQDVDMLVIREMTEDLYAAIEHEIVPGVVQSIKVVTDAASRRFFRFAFEWARTAGRKTVTCVHKANILKLADGLFLEAFRAVGPRLSEMQPSEIIVDNCCMQMVSRPQQFDVMVMGNLYGDLVSDLAAGVVGRRQRHGRHQRRRGHARLRIVSRRHARRDRRGPGQPAAAAAAGHRPAGRGRPAGAVRESLLPLAKC